MAKGKTQITAMIQIGIDSLNEDKEQFKTYQLNGETVQVKIGELVEVPLWVAEAAKRAGDINSFKVV